jgi:hypothetical protein
VTITFVKKILSSGEPCPKCLDVEQRLDRDGIRGRIDRVIVADERDAQSPGMQLATALGVDRAPFFVVETGSRTTVYTVYLKFLREEIHGATSSRDTLAESQELLAAHPDLGQL